jgi:hypothetical protein
MHETTGTTFTFSAREESAYERDRQAMLDRITALEATVAALHQPSYPNVPPHKVASTTPIYDAIHELARTVTASSTQDDGLTIMMNTEAFDSLARECKATESLVRSCIEISFGYRNTVKVYLG